MPKRRLSSVVAVVAEPESKEVRLWVKTNTLSLSPRAARGLAYTLLVSADRAEKRRIPNRKDNHGRHR